MPDRAWPGCGKGCPHSLLSAQGVRGGGGGDSHPGARLHEQLHVAVAVDELHDLLLADHPPVRQVELVSADGHYGATVAVPGFWLQAPLDRGVTWSARPAKTGPSASWGQR